ncbi:MAG: glucosamine-6-phosphate deaminase [Oscillospiraceae bacterium]|jgi:glucosamine-6-phosphate deaminase|nr:glucosamine-6-phosphate deaminase [Oscillospiraceae bacterium]
MNKIICKSRQEAARVGALIIARQIWDKPDSVLGLATGGTPVGMYAILAEMYRAGDLDFSRVTTFNLDEYYPISRENEQSYDYFMWKNLFSHINIDKSRVNLPDGGAADPLAACAEYERKIKAAGGIDLQLLGIGHNGHIAFNEPAQELSLRTGVITLTEQTIKANARFFASDEDVPKKAVSMGIGSILQARKILMLAFGEDKAPAVKKMFSGAVTTQCPATMLALHPDVTAVLDEASASML